MRLKFNLLLVFSLAWNHFAFAQNTTPGISSTPSSQTTPVSALTSKKHKKGNPQVQSLAKPEVPAAPNGDTEETRYKRYSKVFGEEKENRNQIIFDYTNMRPIWNMRTAHYGDTITFHVVNYDSKKVKIDVFGTVIQPNLTGINSLVSNLKNSQGITDVLSVPGDVPVTFTSSVPILATGKYILFSMIVTDLTLPNATPELIPNFYQVYVSGATFQTSIGLMGVFNCPGDLLNLCRYSLNQTPPAIFVHIYLEPGYPSALAATVGASTNSIQSASTQFLGVFLGFSWLYGVDQRLVVSAGTSIWQEKSYPTLAVSFAGF